VSDLHHLYVDGHKDKWYIVWPDGDTFSGPYKRSQDAKSELTKLRKAK
jgi:hypothetical protein